MYQSIRTLGVYCGSRPGNDPKFQQAAQKFGSLHGRMGLSFVFGAGSGGLMGAFAKAALQEGAKVTGVIPFFLEPKEPVSLALTEVIRTQTMAERKAIMAARADGFVVLPGGFGTLDEIAEIITLKQLGRHNKPIVFYNLKGCYDHLIHFFERMVQLGFATETHLTNFRMVSEVEAIYPALCEQLAPPLHQQSNP